MSSNSSMVTRFLSRLRRREGSFFSSPPGAPSSPDHTLSFLPVILAELRSGSADADRAGCDEDFVDRDAFSLSSSPEASPLERPLVGV